MFYKRTTPPILTKPCFSTTICTVPIAAFAMAVFLMAAMDGCARARNTGIERLGVMPIENLGSDAQLDWRSRAAAAVVVYDLAGAKGVFARQVDSLSAAQSMQANRLLAGYFVERNNRIEIHATLENLERNRALESFEISGPASAGFLPLADALARRLSGDARAFSTKNENAFRFYGEALAARDSQDVERALQQATEADPGFAAGFIDQVKVFAEIGDRERAGQVVQAGERANLDTIDRANLQYVAATATGDAAARVKALESLAVATPANANIFKELGEMRFARRQFQQAAMEYRAATGLNPEDAQVWNQLAYALAWNRDLSGAREALAQYQKLAPDDLNVLDSQGEVSYMLGDFKAASGYFERAAAKNPAELVKAAEAQLMMGDLQRADELYVKHFGPGGIRSVGAEIQMAEWAYLTGRRSAAVARMQKLATDSSGGLQALAMNQLSIWKSADGEGKAPAGLEAGPGSRSRMVDIYALMFSKKYGEALPLLQAIYGETNPSSDWQVRTMLARAYLNTGAKGKAAALIRPYPLPLSGSDSLFSAVVFRWYLDLRERTK